MRQDPIPPRLPGALTIDVEEWFHVSAYEGAIDRADWPRLERRAADSARRLLDLFAERDVRATFFTLGPVAVEHPDLIDRMIADGHEVASHGWAHERVFAIGPERFREDLRRAKGALEDRAGRAVLGYRAPSFSIDRARAPWAYDVLAETGHAYSSSSHPIAHDHYGDAAAPRAPHRDPRTGVAEIPIATLPLFGRRWPAGGGGFFRALPLAWFRFADRRLDAEGLTPNFYLHPWEIDPGQPRVHAAPLRSRLRHTLNLARTEAKLARRLTDRAWDRMDRVYAGWIAAEPRALPDRASAGPEPVV